MFANKTYSFGLDISDDSLKFVKLARTKKGIKLKSYGEKKIPDGVVVSGSVSNPSSFKKILLEIKKRERMKSVCLSLPYETLKSEENNFIFKFADVSEEIMASYLYLFKDCKIPVRSMELKAEAVSRSTLKGGEKGTFLLVDLGKERADLFVFSRGSVSMASTLYFSPSFGEQAKENLTDEIRRRIVYWQKKEEKYPTVEKIIICGENEKLVRFSEELPKVVRTKVELADTWVNLFNTERHTPEMTFEESLKYAGAIGAALKGFE